MSKQTCTDCEHRLPKKICGFSKSPFSNQTIDPGETSCEYFEINPAMQHKTTGMFLLLDGIQDESDEENVINEFTQALELGIPEDDAVLVRTLLAGQYATRAFRGLSQTRSDVRNNIETREAIAHIEKAIELDRKGSYGVFINPTNRAMLAKFDALFSMLSSMFIQPQEGENAAIRYNEEKIQLFDYLPTNPLLNVLLDLGVLYATKERYDDAKRCFQKVVDAEPVVISGGDDNSELEYEAKIRGKANENLHHLAEKKKSGGCYIATACYGSYDAPEVITLRHFRDETLSRSRWGQLFVKGYYAYSPSFASWLRKRKIINALIKKYVLDRIVSRIRQQ